jgi:hypothetical protein
MTKVTSKHGRTLAVSGVPIAPGATVDHPDFERAKKSHAVKVWLDKGILVAGKEASKPATGYTVVDKGRGWFVVTKDGAEVTESLREDDVKGFDAMSDADKAAFVDLHKPDA